MKPRSRLLASSAPRNRGFALIAFVLLIVLVAAYVIADALNNTNSELAKAREDRTMDSLRQAKAALIAYAASEEWQLYKSLPSVPPTAYFQPGALPCPDQDNDGDADCVGSVTASMIGRFPWKTVGTDDLRDSSGERLWYALSHDFRKLKCPTAGCTTINSDTLGQLSVTGDAPVTPVVAIVFAPGQAIQGQVRDAANVNTVSNYLEQFDLSNPVNYVFTTKALPSDLFNDRLLVITQADLLAAVEPVVAARIERDVKPYIANYFTDWGIYPYAAPFASPNPGRAQSLYQGALGQTNGLLPLTNAGWAGWQTSPAPSVSQIGGTGTLDSADCSASTLAQISCTISYSSAGGGGGGGGKGGGKGGGGGTAQPTIQLQATLLYAARSFLRPVVQSNLIMRDNLLNTISWEASPAPTVSNALQGSGNASVVFTGGLPDASTTARPITITVGWSYNPINQSADPTAGWFITNQWYRQTYYAVAPDFLLGGGSDCISNPPCLTVNNLASPNNKRVVLVFAGRALNGASRPSGTFADYLENANLTAALGTIPYVYEHRAGSPTSINDRVVVVAP